ncbi:hypothetical protein FOZ76_19855 [Verticiella sediminum]|uniref:DUF7661 domain-containing protein n=1 Tax=Verticiella sediminum TaxID=1247510 RepID=A0A556AB41_9BURK|nr:hypothetical protein [Verticiella sediminum]TSH90102.1 hypothetical protein FOZ76_19855 [Verticiella sediminum]
MLFDIYGRFQLEVLREQGNWVVYRRAPGTRARCAQVVIPSEVDGLEIATYLDDIFHELAGPGGEVRPVPRSDGGVAAHGER